MKHYFGYEADGTLYQQIVIKGGFPAECNLDDPACTHPLSLHIREVQTRVGAKPDAPWVLDGVVKYECPCAEDVGICNCVPAKRLDSYWCVDTSCLRDKPAISILVDGQPVLPNAQITRYPNQLFTVQVVADTPAEMADGSTGTFWSAEMLETGKTEVTFTGGVSNTVTLRAPAQGITGKLLMNGLHLRAGRIFVKGFATT